MQESYEKASDTELKIISTIPERILNRKVPLAELKKTQQILQTKLDLVSTQINEAIKLGIKE